MNSVGKQRTVDASSFLVMETGTLRCASPLSHIVETMRPLPVRPLAGTPPFVTGIAVVRGEPLPVVDLASLLGGTPQTPTRFVIVKTGERKVALAVEVVLGIHHAFSESFAGVPPLLSKAQTDVIQGLGTLDQELLLVLETIRLVPEEVWSGLSKGEAV